MRPVAFQRVQVRRAVAAGVVALVAALALLASQARGPASTAAGHAAHAAPVVMGYERFHADQPSVEGGALLYSELGCANCHGNSPVLTARQGPGLTDAALRMEHEWVSGFLSDPRSVGTGSTMPGLFHGLGDQEVADVVAYLGQLGEGQPPLPAPHMNAARGAQLFREVGCAACHDPLPEPGGDLAAAAVAMNANPHAVPLPDLGRKTSLLALAAFLADPAAQRPDGRMPHMSLDRQESLDIAAYLLGLEDSDPRATPPVAPWPEADEESVARGRQLVTRLNCAACHDLPGMDANEVAPLIAGAAAGAGAADAGEVNGGCLSAEPPSGLPRYSLSSGQLASLRAFLAADPMPRDDGRLTLAAMNCTACHERDGLGGPDRFTAGYFTGNPSLGDAGRIPPPLTGIGGKLKRDWLQRLLEGDEGTRVRPYVATRMPDYEAHAEALAGWLEQLDAPPPAAAADPQPQPDLRPDETVIEAGRKLLGVIGGTHCIACHDWAGERSLGIPGLDLAGLDQRLRPAWFRDYLLDPAGYRPDTLMPALWPDGRSTLVDVLDGDTERQIAAIWAFIAHGEGLPEGFPDRRGGQFELVPADRPIVQRAFFEHAGSRAILVGFPEGVHLAYDGHAARPAVIWRGAFFDAYHTWFSRFPPFDQPLGDHVRRFPQPDDAGAGGDQAAAAIRFRGYELDAAGRPVFLSVRDGREVTETFRAGDDGALVRELRWQHGDAPAFDHPEGVRVEAGTGDGVLIFTYRWP